MNTPLATHLPAEKRIKVCGLIRTSTAQQAGDSRAGIDRQRVVILQTVKSRALDCVAIHTLTDVSGAATASHPTIRNLLAQIGSGQLQGLVVSDLDRVLRPENFNSWSMLQVFRDMGARIYSGDQEFDMTTAEGVLTTSVRTAVAGFELQLIRQRLGGAVEQKRRRGGCPTNKLTLPMGVSYERRSDGEFWCHNPEINRVKELFELFDSGLTNYCELSRRTGINHATIRVILSNAIYLGWRVIDERRGGPKVTSKTGKIYRKKVPRSPEDIIKVKVLEPVVSEEMFARVQAEMSRLKYNHLERLKEFDTVNFGTGGIGICANCGEKLFYISGRAKPRNKKNAFVVCRANHYLYKKRLGGCKQPHLIAREVDDAIKELATKILTQQGWLAKILASSVARTKELVIDIAPQASPSVLLEQLQRRDKKLLEAYEADALTLSEFKDRREAIRREMESLRRLELKAKPEEPDIQRMARLTIKGAMRFASLTDRKQQKQIINELFSEIHIKGKHIISFVLKSGVVNEQTGAENHTVLLPAPIHIGPVPEVLQVGQRRCLRCKQALPLESFYRSLNRCKDCCREECKERRHRHKAERDKDKPAPEVLPEGHKRCSRCSLIQPIASYYAEMNRCKGCCREERQQRRLRRAERKHSGSEAAQREQPEGGNRSHR